MEVNAISTTEIIEILAEFVVIFGVGSVITYWLRGELDIQSLLVVAVIGLIVLFIDEYRKKRTDD